MGWGSATNSFQPVVVPVRVLLNEYSHSHSRLYFYSNSNAICVCLCVPAAACMGACVCLCARMGLLCAFVADACNKPKKNQHKPIEFSMRVSLSMYVCGCAVRSVRPDSAQNSIFHDSSSFEAFFARFVLATAFSSQQQQKQWQPFCLHLTQVYTETHTHTHILMHIL